MQLWIKGLAQKLAEKTKNDIGCKFKRDNSGCGNEFNIFDQKMAQIL